MYLTMQPESANDCARLRIYLTHACPIMRAGLLTILSSQPEFTVSVGEHCAPADSQPVVVVTDYANGMRAARRHDLQPLHGAPRVLVLTGMAKEWEVRQAIDSGVHGYLLLGCSPEELIQSVRLLGRGVTYFSAPAMRGVVTSMSRELLTRRETEVLRGLARGGSDKLIARELGIGVGTVKTHVKHLLEKLDANARTHAVVVALQRGLLSEHLLEADAASFQSASSRLMVSSVVHSPLAR